MCPPRPSVRIAGARKAVMKSRPAGLRVCSRRAVGDHAAVADQHHALDPEALLELADLAGQRRRVADIAFEHFDRDRTPSAVHNSPNTICSLCRLPSRL